MLRRCLHMWACLAEDHKAAAATAWVRRMLLRRIFGSWAVLAEDQEAATAAACWASQRLLARCLQDWARPINERKAAAAAVWAQRTLLRRCLRSWAKAPQDGRRMSASRSAAELGVRPDPCGDGRCSGRHPVTAEPLEVRAAAAVAPTPARHRGLGAHWGSGRSRSLNQLVPRPVDRESQDVAVAALLQHLREDPRQGHNSLPRPDGDPAARHGQEFKQVPAFTLQLSRCKLGQLASDGSTTAASSTPRSACSERWSGRSQDSAPFRHSAAVLVGEH